jgi:hypothetical protein
MAGIYGAKSTYGWQLWLGYTVQQSATENKSTIALELKIYCGTGDSYNQNANSCYYVLQGAKVWSPYSYGPKGWYALGTRTVTVAHDEAGKAGVTLSASWHSGFTSQWTPATLTVSQRINLPDIPRASSVSGELALGQKGTLRIAAASSDFTHDITAKCGTARVTVCTGAAASAEWTPPIAWASQNTGGKTVDVALTTKTYRGGSLVGTKEQTLRATIPQSLGPAVQTGWCAASPDNSGGKASGLQAWVRGYSRAGIAFDASKVQFQYGATAAEYEIVCGGKTTAAAPYRTDVLQGLTAEVLCRVTDSRGYSAETTLTVQLNDYAPPVLTGLALYRSDGAGLAADEGTHICGRCTLAFSALGGANACTLTGYWATATGVWSTGTAMTSGADCIITGDTDILPAASYRARIVARDSLGNEAAYETAIPTSRVTVHLAEGGRAVGIGKYAEHERAVDLAEDWDIWFRGGRLLDAIWPVGSVYISVTDTSPEALFGGTWQRIEDRFLLAAGDSYPLGSTGGEVQHALTAAELPQHTHGYDYTGQSDVTGVTAIRVYDGDSRLNEYKGKATSDCGGQAHNNMPPYMAVNIWKRTA